MFHRHVSAVSTQVSTKNGVVTLKGDVDTQAKKDLTSEYAKDVDGVKEVKNDLTVAKAKPEVKETSGEHIDDASITGQIKVSLFSHRSTSALSTKVETTNGLVTLRGTADNNAERDMASKLSYDVYGVKNVKNEMTIAKK